MKILSMTGFSRVNGTSRNYHFAWEIKAVNSKGLDLRLRVPAGFDAMEQEARTMLSRSLVRGTVYATLTAKRDTGVPQVQINQAMLDAVLRIVEQIPLSSNLRPASLDGILATRGIFEFTENTEDRPDDAERSEVLAALQDAIHGLIDMRSVEGGALQDVLLQRLASMNRLVALAEQAPARKPEAIRARLEQNISLLLPNAGLDPVRLHQEAILLAAKADIREELDRLVTHLAAVQELLNKGGAVGRRLDFLAQELSREVNTLCAKSNDSSLTAIGLDLKTEVEQFREQVQNIE